MSNESVSPDGSFSILEEGSVHSPKGFHSGGLHCGLKRKREDLGWIYSDLPAVSAGVYTTNAFQAAPLIVTKESLAVEQKLQGILVNSANANACTGERGMQDAYTMRRLFAEQIGVPEHFTAIASTGVIGEFLKMDRLQEGISRIDLLSDQWPAESFEKAILTTDTCTKHIGVKVHIDGQEVMIGGASKGSGMIEPNMATMLGFVTTDAALEAESLSSALKSITQKTFNMITVDGDTSTNDMVLIMANGAAQNDVLNEEHPDWHKFVAALEFVCQFLAKEIARDGEGATKLIQVNVTGALTAESARQISKSIISSNLVKTAIYGQDANWGRIVCAIGYSGVALDPGKVSVSIGPIQVVHNGLPTGFDEDEANDYLGQDTIDIHADLGQGDASAVAWGCDLTYEYVRINASYRT